MKLGVWRGVIVAVAGVGLVLSGSGSAEPAKDAHSIIQGMLAACKDNAGDLKIHTALQCDGVEEDPEIAKQDANTLQAMACKGIAPYCKSANSKDRALQAVKNLGCTADLAPGCGAPEATFDRCGGKARVSNLNFDVTSGASKPGDSSSFAFDLMWRDGVGARWGFNTVPANTEISREEFEKIQQNWMRSTGAASVQGHARELLLANVDENCDSLHDLAMSDKNGSAQAMFIILGGVSKLLECRGDKNCEQSAATNVEAKGKKFRIKLRVATMGVRG